MSEFITQWSPTAHILYQRLLRSKGKMKRISPASLPGRKITGHMTMAEVLTDTGDPTVDAKKSSHFIAEKIRKD